MRKLSLLLLVGVFLAICRSESNAQIYSEQDTMAILDTYGNPGDTVDVHFNMINNTVTVAGFFHRIVYDDNLLTALSVDCENRGCILSQSFYDVSVPGVVTFARFPFPHPDSVQNISRGRGNVAYISFEVNQAAQPGTSIVLEFQDSFDSHNGWADSIPENPYLIVPTMVPGNFQIGGGPMNLPPVIGYIGDQEVAEGQTLEFIVTAHDVEADPITLSAQDLPAHATFPLVQGDSLVTGTFTFNPDFDQGPDTFVVTFVAADDHNNVTTKPVQIVVLDQPNDILRVISDEGGIPGATGRSVNINLFSTRSIYGSQFEINYDPEQIDVSDVLSTYRCYNMWFNYNEPDPGRIIIVIFSVGSDTIAAGDGPLADMAVNVSASALFGATNITLSSATEVIDSAGTSKPLTTEDGYFTVDPFGDANLDGIVSVGDCVAIVAYIIGRLDFTVRQFEAADIDSSGYVNIGDLQDIINIILELENPRLVYPPDVPLASVELIKDRQPSNDILTVPLHADIMHEASAVQFEVSYDPVKLVGLDVTRGEMASQMALDYSIAGGTIRGIIYNLGGGSFGPAVGDLLEFSFEITGGTNQSADIELSEFQIVDPGAAFMPVEIIGRLPDNFRLAQNYPNPFNAETNIEFTMSDAASVELSVYDLLGRKVAVLLSDFLPAGSHTVTWDGRSGDGTMMATGVYFYRLKAAEFDETKKMVLVK